MWGRVEYTTTRCPIEGQRVVGNGQTLGREKSALATVMLVAEDMPALHILPMLDAGLLACIHVAICSRPCFRPIHTGLAPFQLRRFPIGEPAGLNALLNPILLIDIPLHVALHALRGSRVGITGDIVVLRPIDRAGLLILRALNTSRFPRRQIAIFDRLGFHPVDPGLPAFQSRCLASAELARL